jgi:DNA-binding beta-propeller fold protein YncE
MNRKRFRFWKGKVLSLGLILSLSVVGAGPLCAQTAGFAYVANSSEGDIGSVSTYPINATTGALTPVPGSPFAAAGGADSVAVSPNGRFAYVANSDFNSNDVSAYTISLLSGSR